MEQAIRAFNKLKEEGVILDYAIGGGVAVTFYTEPIDTYDTDVFVLVPSGEPSLVFDVSTIYRKLSEMGGKSEGQYIIIGDTPVQVLIAPSALEEEAIRTATAIKYGDTPCKVFRPEHLVAICLKTARTRDFYKAMLILEQVSLDNNLLQSLVSRYGLEQQWNRLNSK